jgi:hypothetical protein
MHAHKGLEQLKNLASSPANLDTYTKAAVLIDGLLRTNTFADTGERANEIVNSKLRSARSWFEILCGIGEDGNWPEDRLRDILRSELFGAGMHIESDGLYFKRWPALAEKAEP